MDTVGIVRANGCSICGEIHIFHSTQQSSRLYRALSQNFIAKTGLRKRTAREKPEGTLCTMQLWAHGDKTASQKYSIQNNPRANAGSPCMTIHGTKSINLLAETEDREQVVEEGPTNAGCVASSQLHPINPTQRFQVNLDSKCRTEDYFPLFQCKVRHQVRNMHLGGVWELQHIVHLSPEAVIFFFFFCIWWLYTACIFHKAFDVSQAD